MTPEQNRDRVRAMLPEETFELIEREKDDNFVRGPGAFSVGRLSGDCFSPPRNRHEQEVHRFFVELGCVPFRKGWPDFLICPKKGDLFAVEVKGPEDFLSVSQCAVLTLLSQKMDVYVWWSGEMETIGDSTPWEERVGVGAAV